MTLRPTQPQVAAGWTTLDWTNWLASTGALLSVRATDHPACSRCRRPVGLDNAGQPWARCYHCWNVYRGGTRSVVPICYAFSGHLTSLIRQAKDEPDRRWLQVPLACLLFTFLQHHRACLARVAGGQFDVATVVPSHPTSRGGWDHLKDMHARVTGTWPGPQWDLELLTKAGQSVAGQRRARVQADEFQLRPGANVWGKRVLLIDDLYTSGGTTGSASAALTNRGATTVIVTLGRHIDSNDPLLPAFVQTNGLGTRGWEIGTCAVHT
jgi:predicted amidophosphoribosyltransferase